MVLSLTSWSSAIAQNPKSRYRASKWAVPEPVEGAGVSISLAPAGVPCLQDILITAKIFTLYILL
jgi:hypothetical protein